MTTGRAFGSVCLAALLWVAGLGAAVPASARLRTAHGAAEVAMQAANATPVVGLRDPVPTLQRLPQERHAPPSGAGGAVGLAVARRAQHRPMVRVRLSRQAEAYVARPQWRRYDATAPPARLRRDE